MITDKDVKCEPLTCSKDRGKLLNAACKLTTVRKFTLFAVALTVVLGGLVAHHQNEMTPNRTLVQKGSVPVKDVNQKQEQRQKN